MPIVPVLVLSAVLAATAAAAGEAGPPIIIVTPGLSYGGPGTSCREDVRLHHTLRDGYFPYCRERMRYRPGAFECTQVTDRICTIVDPVSLQLVEARMPTHRHRIPCPDGPEPPLCRKLDFQ